MSLFNAKDSAAIKKARGRYQVTGNKFSEEDIVRTVTLLSDLMREGKDGFFFVVGKENVSDDHAKAEGVSSVHNMSRKEVLDIILKTLDMDKGKLMRYSLMDSSLS